MPRPGLRSFIYAVLLFMLALTIARLFSLVA